jgi:hypothetical protein
MTRHVELIRLGYVLEGVLSRKESSVALLPWWNNREKARKGEEDDKVLRT